LNNYIPIACALHEQYQFAVIKRAWLELDWNDGLGGKRACKVRPKDVYTRDKAEFLLAEMEDGVEVEIRLDRIRKAVWAQTGESLMPR